MAERPIIFSAESVRAILNGSKTVTRRVVKPQPPDGITNGITELEVGLYHPTIVDRDGIEQPGKETFGVWSYDGEYGVRSPYGRPGDTLWVKETWQYANWTEDGYPFVRYLSNGAVLLHENIPEESDDSLTAIWCELSESENYDIDGKAADRKWRSPIFMPRWASRLTLTVTDVRVERLQDITETDAIAEGMTLAWVPGGFSHVTEYAKLWDTINAKRGFPWESNPWVWRVAFSRVGGANA